MLFHYCVSNAFFLMEGTGVESVGGDKGGKIGGGYGGLRGLGGLKAFFPPLVSRDRFFACQAPKSIDSTHQEFGTFYFRFEIYVKKQRGVASSECLFYCCLWKE